MTATIGTINVGGLECVPKRDYDALAARLAAVEEECADLIAGKEYQAMQRTLSEVNARLAERLVAYCVCTEQKSPVKGCDCVCCTTTRLEARLAAVERVCTQWNEWNSHLRTRLAEAEALLRDVKAWIPNAAGAAYMTRRRVDAFLTPADSATAVTCDHFPGQTGCEWCKGTGAIDAPTSADDPSCPNCDGEGTWAKSQT
jgi:hypothetical protein